MLNKNRQDGYVLLSDHACDAMVMVSVLQKKHFSFMGNSKLNQRSAMLG